MSNNNILLVEDEPYLGSVLKDSLIQKKYNVILANNGEEAYRLYLKEDFKLCVIDVMLPLMDGFSLAKKIRSHGSKVPILFLTARKSDKDVIEGFHSGGNDYLKKPFSLEELFLRINELIVRFYHLNIEAKSFYEIGEYIFIPHKQTLQYKHEPPIKLSNKETLLLQLLLDHKNQLLERKKALLSLWNDDNFFNGRTMDVFITKLRKHLREDKQVEILNLRGLGYKLIC